MSPSQRSVLTRSARLFAVAALALTSLSACDLPAEPEFAAGLQQAFGHVFVAGNLFGNR